MRTQLDPYRPRFRLKAALCVLSLFWMITGLAQVDIVIDGKSVVKGGATCGAESSLIGFEVDGTEICECLEGRTDCGAGCIDLEVDGSNCGACGISCGEGESCVNGACRECDVLLQDCANPGDACFMTLAGDAGRTFCAAPFLGENPGEQGDACNALNACAEGYGCSLLNIAQDGFECARYCDLGTTFPPPDVFCETEAGPGFYCVRLSDFYSDEDIQEKADDTGMCVGPDWIL